MPRTYTTTQQLQERYEKLPDALKDARGGDEDVRGVPPRGETAD